MELAGGIIAAQDTARVFPGDRRTGFHLGPDDLRTRTATIAALGHEVVDAADPVLVARIPVLHRRVLDAGVIQRHQLDHGGMQLVLVAHRRGAAFKIGDVAPSSAMIKVRSNWPVCPALMRK
jgi:hypothetical protein